MRVTTDGHVLDTLPFGKIFFSGRPTRMPLHLSNLELTNACTNVSVLSLYVQVATKFANPKNCIRGTVSDVIHMVNHIEIFVEQHA